MLRRVSVGIVVLGATSALAAEGFEFFDAEELPYAGNRIVLADVDGDGITDLLRASLFDLTLHSGDGAGGFAEGGQLLFDGDELPDDRLAVVAVRPSDIDRDGDPDLVLSLALSEATGDVRIAVLENDGAGAFTTQIFTTRRTDPASGARIDGGYSVAVVDTDRDGSLDLVCPTRFSQVLPEGRDYSQLSVYSRGSDGRYAFSGTIPSPTPFINTVDAADLDGDGRDDLVLGSNLSHVLLARAEGGFDPVERPEGPPFLGVPLFLRDVDRDGHVDLLSYTALHFGEGDGTFVRSVATPHIVSAGRSALVDLDNDLDLDVVSTDPSNNTTDVVIALFDDGALTDCGSISSGADSSRLSWVAADDLDGDGLVDLVAVESVGAGPIGGDEILVIRQAGSPAPTGLTVSPARIDSDGPLDVTLSGEHFVAGATVSLADGIAVAETIVDGPSSATARVDVAAGVGGGVRPIVLTNPDGRRTETSVELLSVRAQIRNARLRDRITPSDDVLRVKGRIARNRLSSRDAFTGRDLGMVLEIGSATRPLEIVIPADDPRWIGRRGGKRLIFQTEPSQFPRIRMVVNTRKETFVLKVSQFDYAESEAPVRFAYRSAEDIGRDAGAWRPRRGSKLLRFRAD